MKRPSSFWIVLALAAGPNAAPGQTPAEDFQQNCAMCHTIGGGPLAGPDLADMSERRERSWLVRFIVDPQAVIDSGDPVAQEMVDEYQGMVMPASPGMTPERADALIDYVAEQSGGGAPTEAPEAQEAREPEPAPAQADVETGRRLFRGDVALEKGGAACLACHDLAGLSWLGGGALGPELTGVYDRLGGRQGLTAWLSAPPTPTMSSLYRTRPLTEDEVRAFTALFADRASQEAPAGLADRAQLLLLGLAGTALLLLLFDRLWRKRFRGVRRRLVRTSRMRGVQ
ncbi:MAG: c-type cytochrome [Bryobacterales bacterium]|nr:c-type cytochrome [Bryobacterales bacterium]